MTFGKSEPLITKWLLGDEMLIIKWLKWKLMIRWRNKSENIKLIPDKYLEGKTLFLLSISKITSIAVIKSDDSKY
ncbi:hypothetical protein GBG21_13735 [Aeribacillus pallidus]